MNNKIHLLLTILAVLITTSLAFIPNPGSLVNTATAQSPICDNGVVTTGSPSHALPVILIHGYKENSNVWAVWENLLFQNNIPFCTVSFLPSFNFLFDYDACGSAEKHSKDIEQIVQLVKDVTEQDKVNIVAHSKGGLDARVYLDDTNTPDVANLIMIGTPNAGGLFADSNVFNPLETCIPAAWDLTSFAPSTRANQNLHTNYYTIAGVCFDGLLPNDGLVAKSSVHSEPYFHSLADSPNCHLDLLGSYEYGLVNNILNNG